VCHIDVRTVDYCRFSAHDEADLWRGRLDDASPENWRPDRVEIEHVLSGMNGREFLRRQNDNIFGKLCV
jgi:hypothetical protein